ncbi:MAG: TM0106 family RecB-like putative nuclease [Candidatus Eisenbacteria bacterium]
MKFDETTFRLSATDLANHLACRHLTTLDRGQAEGKWSAPDWFRPEAALLRERGMEHERAYLDHLAASGLEITRVGADDALDLHGLEGTVAAMFAGREVIVQATLAGGRWLGRADVLRRVEIPSGLGAWSYEALDTKLARETKAGTILQLCLYSELLKEIQGVLPREMHVVPRRPGLAADSYRVEDYIAYYRLVRRRLESELDAATGAPGATYPEPCAHCDICRWWPQCDRRRRADDHLSLVAGISRVQTRELEARAVATLERLAGEPLPIAWRPARGARDGYRRVREQARVQRDGRAAARVLHELLPLEPGRGLAALPAPSPGDLFLDLEANSYVDDGGIEYLFGWVVADAAPADAGALPLDLALPSYHRRWGLDRAGERAGFETLIDTILARWEVDPGMHVYHYGAYEPAALKRVMGRHATREAGIDRLLRAGRFVDLHAVVKHALRASVEEYSIKKLEPLYGFARAQKLDEAGAALRVLERDLELGRPIDPADTQGRIVEAYNRDDCLSARALRDWLESLRAELVAGGAEIARPVGEPGDPSEEVGEREARTLALAERLRAGVPEDAAARSDEQNACWLLANLLDWHRREEKTAWWEYFRLRELADEDLLDENGALAGLEFVEALPVSGRSALHRYRFPGQESAIRRGDQLHLPMPDGRALGSVEAVDHVARTIDVKKSGACAELHPTSVFRHELVRSQVLADALLRLGTWVADHGVAGPGPHRAERDLLLGRGPRLAGGHDAGPLAGPDEDGVAAARRLVVRLEGGALAIQGPPGSGKTYTGARMITELVRAGRTVGICAVSHKVITNLLREVGVAAAEEALPVARLQKVKDSSADPAGIVETRDNGAVRAALNAGTAQVAGGTAWMWARPEFVEAVDVLFVDEAGQMSLANVLALAQGGTNLVLLGDPSQLEQPIQGTHPDGSAVSALQHVLGAHATMPGDKGLFLAETWRMSPPICDLTSELFYEGRLRPHDGLERQALVGDVPYAGAGLWFVPAQHDANQSASAEEAVIVERLVARLTAGDVRWRDHKGVERIVGLADVLVIAPYNAQVADLAARLPQGARVGTVDKFQGQEAPAVIYSMTTSTPEDAPRGMEFLYNKNRFNVATSRARCACIVVGSPRLFEPDCRNPRQMQLANAFCRFLEVAREIAP